MSVTFARAASMFSIKATFHIEPESTGYVCTITYALLINWHFNLTKASRWDSISGVTRKGYRGGSILGWVSIEYEYYHPTFLGFRFLKVAMHLFRGFEPVSPLKICKWIAQFFTKSVQLYFNTFINFTVTQISWATYHRSQLILYDCTCLIKKTLQRSATKTQGRKVVAAAADATTTARPQTEVRQSKAI